jgi:hypothetical protein
MANLAGVVPQLKAERGSGSTRSRTAQRGTCGAQRLTWDTDNDEGNTLSISSCKDCSSSTSALGESQGE